VWASCALLTVVLSACDWQPFGFNTAQTRFNSESNSPSALTARWSVSTGEAVDTTPAVVGGVAYLGTLDGKVHALKAATRANIWTFATGGAVASPAVANGIVYVGP
jgi:outer membrane protein assembly factor BamB